MIVFTNGCFDMLHAGHVQMLQYCRYLAQEDPLYVGIDSDSNVRAAKGSQRPYYSEAERTSMLMRLSANGVFEKGKLNPLLVDWVYPFDNDEELYGLIKKLNPHYLVKGDEWIGKKVIGDDIAPVLFYPTFFKQRCSTSEFERRILQRNLLENDSEQAAHSREPSKESHWRPVNWRRNR